MNAAATSPAPVMPSGSAVKRSIMGSAVYDPHELTRLLLSRAGL